MEQRDLLENIQCHSELDHSKSKWFLKAIVLSTGCAVKLPSDSESLCLTTPAWKVGVRKLLWETLAWSLYGLLEDELTQPWMDPSPAV